MAFQHEQAFLHEWDGVKAQQKSVDEIVIAADCFDLRHHPRRIETLVRCAGKNETFERLEIDCVRRHSRVDDGRALRRFTHGTGVTNRAVQKNAFDPLRVAAGARVWPRTAWSAQGSLNRPTHGTES